MISRIPLGGRTVQEYTPIASSIKLTFFFDEFLHVFCCPGALRCNVYFDGSIRRKKNLEI